MTREELKKNIEKRVFEIGEVEVRVKEIQKNLIKEGISADTKPLVDSLFNFYGLAEIILSECQILPDGKLTAFPIAYWESDAYIAIESATLISKDSIIKNLANWQGKFFLICHLVDRETTGRRFVDYTGAFQFSLNMGKSHWQVV